MRGDAIQGRGKGNANQLQKDFDRIREKVEKFTGERGDAIKTLSAVRRSEFAALQSLGLQSSQVTGNVSVADFNALQKDVAAIFNALARISNVHGTADIPKV